MKDEPEAWHRYLNDGRVEMSVKSDGLRLRVTASEEQAWEAIEMFERWSGRAIESERRPRRRARIPDGQLQMTGL